MRAAARPIRPPAVMNEMTGQVALDGRPAERLIMNLTPAEKGEGREDKVVIQQGEYRVRLIAGRYKVAFTPAPDGPAVPRQFKNPQTSGLELDARTSGLKNFDLR